MYLTPSFRTTWCVLWCIISRLRVCVDTRRKASSLCISTFKDTREELSYLWFGIGNNCCLKDMEALLVWKRFTVLSDHKSLKYLFDQKNLKWGKNGGWDFWRITSLMENVIVDHKKNSRGWSRGTLLDRSRWSIKIWGKGFVYLKMLKEKIWY